MFLALFLSSTLAVAFLLLLTSSKRVNLLKPVTSDNISSSAKMTKPLPPQQLVDLKDFQFTINNDICGRRAISIAHWVAFGNTFYWEFYISETFFVHSFQRFFCAQFFFLRQSASNLKRIYLHNPSRGKFKEKDELLKKATQFVTLVASAVPNKVGSSVKELMNRNIQNWIIYHDIENWILISLYSKLNAYQQPYLYLSRWRRAENKDILRC